jgi:hypothetical protein
MVAITLFLTSCQQSDRPSKEQKEYNRDVTFLRGVVVQVKFAFVEDTARQYTNVDKTIRDLEARHIFGYLKSIRTNQSLLFNPDVEKWRRSCFVNSAASVSNELAIVFSQKHTRISGTNDAYVGVSFGGAIILTNKTPFWPSLRRD